MRRSILLALSVALVALVFAPTVTAQTNYQGGGNQGMNSGGMDNMGMGQPRLQCLRHRNVWCYSKPHRERNGEPVCKLVGQYIG